MHFKNNFLGFIILLGLGAILLFSATYFQNDSAISGIDKYGIWIIIASGFSSIIFSLRFLFIAIFPEKVSPEACSEETSLAK